MIPFDSHGKGSLGAPKNDPGNEVAVTLHQVYSQRLI